MKRIFTKEFKRLFAIAIIIFIALFIFRLGYGYTLPDKVQHNQYMNFENFSIDKRNYASSKFKGKEIEKGPSLNALDQKYEKIASVNAGSDEFNTHEKKVRQETASVNGIIQYERKKGNDGDRSLQLQIGVPPAKFEQLYTQLIEFGKVDSKEIIKNDKTNEYLQLNARKASLEKTLNSLILFKEKGGKIDEFINLENRILEIQENLQQLGVNLGVFDESNEFCTIKYSLVEIEKKSTEKISLYHRIKVALSWTITTYLLLMFGLFLAGLIIYGYLSLQKSNKSEKV